MNDRPLARGMSDPWVEVVDREDAGPDLEEAYAAIEASRGRVGNVFKATSLNPDAMRAHEQLYNVIAYGESPLSRKDRELIGLAVSRANDSQYCITHHADALGRHTNEPGLASMVATNYALAEDLTPRERAILDHSVKLTREPGNVGESDVTKLKNTGVTDREIVDLTLACAYFNFVNRVANGLGVPADDVEGPFLY